MAKAYVRRTGDVAELVISAPPLNLFDGQLAADLASALDEVTALTREGAARGAAPGRGQGVLRRRGRALVARAGVARAAELVMTGDSYPAAEMQQWGVVNPRETGQIFATRDLPAGLTSLLEQGPGQATFEGR